jgi:primosomal protein N' (replication factor Y)
MRPSGQPLPAVEIIDMRREMEVRRRERRPKGDADEEQRAAERRKTSERRVISRALAAALVETFQAGEQTILFLNRRGYATFAFCLECGEPLQCPRCEIALTYSDKRKELRCHYCDYATPEPATCPKCAGVNLFFGGMGTERLEDEVAKVVPGARLARMDRDTVRDRGDLYRILCAFAKGESDILLGTQMVAKGHDFPRVTLVGVVDADAALVLPDYRAAERAFSLVSQVAGRAGRADRPGRVLLQTFQPEHYAISTAARHDYAAFYAEEVARRSRLHYPPATRMAVLRITTPTAGLGVKACRLASQAAAAATDPADVAGAATIGPAPAMLHRLKGLHHWHLLVKAEKAAGLHKLCARILAFVHRERMPDGTYRLDVDPVSVM